MTDHLKNEMGSFDFYIQCYKNEIDTPIEDAGKKWDTEMIKVGHLELPIQEIDTAERFEVAEQLSFSPANALKVHEPIGGINRARIQIYTHLSKFRHERNEEPQIEPDSTFFNNLK